MTLSQAPRDEPEAPFLRRLCSAPPDQFAAEIWSRRAWLSRAADLPGQQSPVFSQTAADELLSRRGLRTPFLRLAKDGRVLPTSRFTGSGGIGAKVADQVIDDEVLKLFADGTTLVLQGLHRTWQPVGELAAGLADDLGHPVQVNAYITPPQSQGFAPHYDTHDVFVLQVAGRKRWRVHPPVVESPLPDQPWDTVATLVEQRANEPADINEVLLPGDCLYLPRGFVHSALAMGETSIHLTFGIHPVVKRDVVHAVLETIDAQGWRESLPVGWDPTSPQGMSEITAVLSDLAAAIAGLDATVVGATLHDQRAGLQRPEPISPLAQANTAVTLRSDDPVRLRRHLGARLAAHDQNGWVLMTGRRSINIVADELPAVRSLLTGDRLTAEQLPLEAGDALALVRRLLLAGVLTEDHDH